MESSGDQPPKALRVLFLAAEADPLVKVGGLGDVAGSLPPALRHLGSTQPGIPPIDARLVIPFHGVIDPAAYNLQRLGVFEIPHRPTPLAAEIFSTELNGLPVYLISGSPFAREAPVYSIDTRLDGVKFAFFSLAALKLAEWLGWAPDILHANDWHTALAVYALSLIREHNPFFSSTQSVLTIHNLPFMGVGAEPVLGEFNLPPALGSQLPEWARQTPLPLGLLSADWLVAVSPTYAREILTPAFGSGLEGFLRTREDTLSGILNGLDTNTWDPSRDPNGIVNYSPANLGLRSSNKTTLQRRFSLPETTEDPLLYFIGRMDPQKGVDLVLEALKRLADLPWQAIILGSGLPALEEQARLLEIDFPDRVRAVLRFDGRLAHQLYAGGDILMMPSRYEPCGLAQMIAMRYGSIPVARATGGLLDTIQDAARTPPGTGFLFQRDTPDALENSLRQALTYRTNPTYWQAMQQQGMAQDFSWEASAAAYARLYIHLKETSR